MIFHLEWRCFQEVLVKSFALHRAFVLGKTIAFLLITICLVAGNTSAQNAMACHDMGTRDQIAPEKLPPPQKLTGIGNSHIRITATHGSANVVRPGIESAA